MPFRLQQVAKGRSQIREPQPSRSRAAHLAPIHPSRHQNPDKIVLRAGITSPAVLRACMALSVVRRALPTLLSIRGPLLPRTLSRARRRP
jgi:hypothetical protein